MNDQTQTETPAATGNDGSRDLTRRAMFLAGCGGALLAYGSYWIREFAAIETWYENNGPFAAIGAIVFLFIIVVVAGWVTLESRPSRSWGAILTGLGVPGVILAANVAASTGVSEEDESEDAQVEVSQGGGWAEFLRPVFAPTTVTRNHNEQAIRNVRRDPLTRLAPEDLKRAIDRAANVLESDADAEARRLAAERLASFRHPDAREALRKATDDPDPDVSRIARQAVRRQP